MRSHGVPAAQTTVRRPTVNLTIAVSMSLRRTRELTYKVTTASFRHSVPARMCDVLDHVEAHRSRAIWQEVLAVGG